LTGTRLKGGGEEELDEVSEADNLETTTRRKNVKSEKGGGREKKDKTILPFAIELIREGNPIMRK